MIRIMAPNTHRRTAVTLVELVVVLAVLVALAAVAIPLIGNSTGDAARTATQASLRLSAEAIQRYRADTLFTPDNNQFVISDLFQRRTATYEPTTRIGWNGPYLSSGGATYTFSNADAYGFTAEFAASPGTLEPCLYDAFPHTDGHRCPVVLVKRLNTASGKVTVWLQSAGPDGILSVPTTVSGPPVPSTSGDGTDFLVGGTYTHADDLIYTVYTQP